MEIINILLSCDKRPVRYIPVLMNSLYKNHYDKKIHIYLMHSGIPINEINTLCDFANRNGHFFFDIVVDKKDLDFFKKVDPRRYDKFPLEAYFHLLAHEYLPESLNRILYLDIDVICTGDISFWYNSDFKDNFFVATDGYTVRDFKVFNSGCFLINIEKLRKEKNNKEFFAEKVKELLQENINNLVGDQEFLGYSYRSYKNNGFICQPDPGMNYRLRNKPKEAYGLAPLPELKLIHYSTTFKAWNYVFDDDLLKSFVGRKIGGNPPFDFSVITETMKYTFDFFWKYAKGTPYFNEIYNSAIGSTNELKHNLNMIVEAKKKEDLLNSLNSDNTYKGIIGQIPTFNKNGFVYIKNEKYQELRTIYYIKEQWIIFPLKRKLKKGQCVLLEIDCEYKTENKIYLFLSDYKLKTQHFPSLSKNDYKENIVVNQDGYGYICLSSNSFKSAGDFIRIFNIEASYIE